MIAISDVEAQAIVGVLRLLEEFIQGSIDSACVPGTGEPMEENKADVEAERTVCRTVEGLVVTLERRLRSRTILSAPPPGSIYK